MNRKLSVLVSCYGFRQRRGVALTGLLGRWRPGRRGVDPHDPVEVVGRLGYTTGDGTVAGGVMAWGGMICLVCDGLLHRSWARAPPPRL